MPKAPIGPVSAIWKNEFQGAPTGTRLQCKDWPQEAILRLLNNNLDPGVAEDPERLIVYGGTGRAARNWAAYDAIIQNLRTLESDETLLIQSGKPVGRFRTHDMSPRVLIANSHLVPHWADWETFRKLEGEGLIMYGQMTAGAWQYIGSQGIIQGTFETLAELARQHYDGTLNGKWTLTAGLGGMGGAQPLAVTMNGGACLAVEVDETRATRRVAERYCDAISHDLDEALGLVLDAAKDQRAYSVGLVGNAGDILPELVHRGVTPDIVTDQTSSHDELNGYIPMGMPLADALTLRATDPAAYTKASYATMAAHWRAVLTMQERGAIAFEYGNNIRGQVQRHAGVANAFDVGGFVPLYIRPQFCEGRGPFRWLALSGDKADIYATDKAVLDLFPKDESLARWIRLAEERVAFQGLPARVCWLGYGERHLAALRFNEMVANGELTAPIAVTRDHLDSGSVASPYRETEGMQDGSDAIADWPLLNALVNTAAGADVVALHHGGGVGIGYSIHAGMTVVLDGTDRARRKAERVFLSDPGMGVIRHADAGYEKAQRVAEERGVKRPME